MLVSIPRQKNKDGEVERIKTRRVAKEFSQRCGVDYEKSFAPSPVQIDRVVLRMATKYGIMLHQMDVKTALLNGFLDEDIYMEQSDVYLNIFQPDYLCKLK